MHKYESKSALSLGLTILLLPCYIYKYQSNKISKFAQIRTSKMSQIERVYRLSQVYSTKEQELINRHSINLTKIKHKFQYLYQGCTPEYYVIGKGMCYIGGVQHKQLHDNGLAMLIQNGISIAIKPTTPKDKLYINYNIWQHELHNTQHNQQLILSPQGNILTQPQAISNMDILDRASLMARLYRLATEDVSLNKMYGAVLYVDGKLGIGDLGEREAFVWAVFVAFLAVNRVEKQYSVEEIGQKLVKFTRDNGTAQDTQQMQKYSKMQQTSNPPLHLTHPSTKLILYRLPTSHPIPNLLAYLTHHQSLQPHTHIPTIMKNIQQLYKAYTQKAGIQQNQKFPSKLSECLLQTEGFFVTGCGRYVVICCCAGRVYDYMRKLAIQMKEIMGKEGEKEEGNGKDILEGSMGKYGRTNGKWGRSSISIQDKLFSTMPTCGIKILDPKQQLWFNQNL